MQLHAVGLEGRHLARQRQRQQFHQAGDFLGGAVPVLGREGKHRQHGDAARHAGLDTTAQGAHALLVAGHTRQKTLARPAAVAIHHDGHVVGNLGGAGGGHVSNQRRGADQTAMMSCSLAATSLSTSAMNRSVDFCTSSCARRSSSSEASLSLTSFLTPSLASRRRLRIATLACSPSARTTLVSSLRRSSVMAGMGTRIRSPWVAGLRPRSESRMAFSILAPMPFSHGDTLMVRASSSDTLATWLIGTMAP
eukprot:Amastigsp_a175776_3.p1 type:complete len:251 gc:universal Amastigsp_a175776_3:890-138(-)